MICLLSMKPSIFSAGTGIAIAYSFLLGAAHASTDSDLNILVTANRRPTTVDDAFQSVSVIRRSEIEARNPQSLADLLQGLPGIQINRNGGLGRTTTLLMRGANANQVLVLVDGLRASSISNGEFDWNSVLPEQIDRIEIVRGPLASLYGSDAVAGVIQIFTKKFEPGYSAEQTLGSFGTRKTSAQFSGGDEWRYSINGGTFHTNGIQNLVNNPRTYSFNQNTIGVRLGRDFNADRRLKINLNQTEGKSALDNGPTNSGSFNRSFDFEDRVNDLWSYSLKLGWLGSKLEVPFEYPPGLFQTERKSVSLHNLFKLGDGVLTLGSDIWSENAVKLDYENSANNLDKNLHNASVFAQYEVEWEKIKWQLALRQDHQNFYGSAKTYNLGLSKPIAPGWLLSASHGTAFKAPTTNDLFWPHSSEANQDWSASPPVPLSAALGTCGPSVAGNPVPCTYDFAGNPGLRPESSKTTEFGLRFNGDFRFGMNYFETQIKDLIEWDSYYGGIGQEFTQFYAPTNVASVRMRGLELSYSRSWNAWKLNTQWTALSAINLATNQQLDRRPKQAASLALGYQWEKHLTRTEFLMVSSRLNNSGQKLIPGYAIVNLSDYWKINPHWAFVTRLENVFDTRYINVANGSNVAFATPRRSAYLTLRYNMK